MAPTVDPKSMEALTISKTKELKGVREFEFQRRDLHGKNIDTACRPRNETP